MPITDAEMIYDINEHKYFLTQYGYEHNSGEHLSQHINSEDIEPLLKRVTYTVYNYIYSWASDVSRTEYEISLSKYRLLIKRALVEMVSAMLVNKTDMGLFFSKDSGDIVTPNVKLILMNGGLLKRSKFPYINYDALKEAGEY